nr:hypothetical protein CFP56_22100 [Quercus suber]
MGMLEHTASSSIFLYTSRDENDFDNYGDEEGDEVIQHEKIRPYAQKWEKEVIRAMFIMNSMMGFCLCLLLPSILTRRLCLSFLNIMIGGF